MEKFYVVLKMIHKTGLNERVVLFTGVSHYTDKQHVAILDSPMITVGQMETNVLTLTHHYTRDWPTFGNTNEPSCYI